LKTKPKIDSTKRALQHTTILNHKEGSLEEVTDDDEQSHSLEKANSDIASNENHEFSDENKNLILHLLPTLKGKILFNTTDDLSFFVTLL
jgi:hypothetical protein